MSFGCRRQRTNPTRRSSGLRSAALASVSSCIASDDLSTRPLASFPSKKERAGAKHRPLTLDMSINGSRGESKAAVQWRCSTARRGGAAPLREQSLSTAWTRSLIVDTGTQTAPPRPARERRVRFFFLFDGFEKNGDSQLRQAKSLALPQCIRGCGEGTGVGCLVGRGVGWGACRVLERVTPGHLVFFLSFLVPPPG